MKMVVLKATLVQYAASFLGLFLSLPFGVGAGGAQLDNSIPIILEMTMIHPFFSLPGQFLSSSTLSRMLLMVLLAS